MLVYPYKFGSKSGKALAEALGAKRIKHKNSKFKGRGTKTVINWGASKLPDEVLKCNVLNNPTKVALVSNKLNFFNHLEQYNEALMERNEPVQLLSYPDWTTDKVVAQEWLDEGKTVVERHKLTGNSGEGIVITEPEGELGNAKLYTKYIPKKEEYRVHVFKDQPIDIQRKARVRDVPDDEVNWKVRNLDGGFIFARNDGQPMPPLVAHYAVLAVKACGLDFGAVDVVYNEKQHMPYVLEINTAPGLMGTTLEKYIDAFNE